MHLLQALAEGYWAALVSTSMNISPTVDRRVSQAPVQCAQLEWTGWLLSGRCEVCRHGINWMFRSSDFFSLKMKKVLKVTENGQNASEPDHWGGKNKITCTRAAL